MACLLARRLLRANVRGVRFCSSNFVEEAPGTSGEHSRGVTLLPSSFERLGITRAIDKSLRTSMSISRPKPVQVKAIPRLLEGYDVMIQAETGSGKTLAFLLPLLQNSRHICATLVIVPSRELAVQILKTVNAVFPPHAGGDFGVALVSGHNMQLSAEHVRQAAPRVIIGTPKRLMELMTASPDLFSTVKHIVLDEIDKLIPPEPPSKKLQKKRHHHVKPALAVVSKLKDRILAKNQSVQLVAVSATLSHAIRASLLDLGFSETSRLVYMQDKIGVPSHIWHQFAVYPNIRFSKVALLTQIHTSLSAKKVLVIMHTEAPINVFVQELRHCGINAEALHEHQANPESLDKYSAFYKEFEQGEIEMVIANPSTVRGLDFPFLEHIILVEVPSDYIEYLHAAGRVGRLGGRGTVTTLVCNDGKSLHRLTFIYQKLGLTALKVVPESLSADTGEKEPWDKSDAIELDRTDVHHENRSTSVHETLEPEVTETDDSSFKLDEEIDPDEHKDLLESDYAVPVVSDLPYDVNSLGKRKQFEDLDER